MEGSGVVRKRAIVAYAHPRTQGTDRPVARATRGVSVLQRGWRHDLRGQGAGASRPRAQLSGRVRSGLEDRRAAGRSRPARSHCHRLGGGGAGAREQPDQAAYPKVQHPAARRQELPLSPVDVERGVSTRVGRPARRTRRQLLRRTVSAGAFRAEDDVAHAPAVRHPVVQRSDHRQARAPLPRVRHQALHRAVRRHALHPGGVRPRRQPHAAVPRGQERRAREDAPSPDARRRGGRTFRRGRAAIASRRWRPPSSATATCSD